MKEIIRLDYNEFKRQFLEVFRSWMINKTGAVAETGNVQSFVHPYKHAEREMEKIYELSEKYPDYYERISEEEWML